MFTVFSNVASGFERLNLEGDFSQPNPVKNSRSMVIAIMGGTGAGKSTFVRRLTGQNDIKIGHSLRSSKLSTATSS
jgi:putative ribosome biogenesis GTPase RsgA